MNDKLLKGGDVEIQSIRFGRTIRVKPEALEKFLQERTISDGHGLKLPPGL
jgi:hypothetical protein